MVRFVTDWAGPLGWWILIQLVFIFAGVGRGLQLAVLAVVALVSNAWIKWIVAEPRPFMISTEFAPMGVEQGFGMPSGHAQGAAAVWGWLAWTLRRLWPLMAVAIFLLIATGLTRAYLAVHSPAQVLVGWALGLITLLLLLRYWPTLSDRCQRLSWPQMWLCLLGSTLICLAINALILSLTRNFAVPELWLIRYAEVTGVDQAQAADLKLFNDNASLLWFLGCGFVSIAILDHRWKASLSALPNKFLALNIVVVAVFAFILAARQLGSSYLALSMVAFAQPVFCLYLPMRLIWYWRERPRQSNPEFAERTQ